MTARTAGIGEALRGVAGIDFRAEVFAAGQWVDNLETALCGLTGDASRFPRTILFNNGMQLALIVAALERHKVGMPEEVSLMAFGDSADAERLGITVIRQPVERLGRLAAEIVAAKRGEHSGMRLPCQLFERNSIKRII